MNRVFTFFVSFCFGMSVMVPAFSYIKKDSHPKYLYKNPTMLYPKHPIVECVRNPECAKLAEASYFESRSETNLGVLAVMKTILNRKAHPRWENSVKGVIEAPRQFSYTHDGSIAKAEYDVEQWARMYYLAYRIMKNKVTLPKEWDKMTHYLTVNTHTKWSREFEQVVVIGNHKFYNCKRRC